MGLPGCLRLTRPCTGCDTWRVHGCGGNLRDNQTIGATAILESFDTPATALEQLEQWVNDQFGQREEQGITLRNANHDLYETQVQLQKVRSELETAKERWEAVKRLAERLGVDLLARVSDLDDIPF